MSLDVSIFFRKPKQSNYFLEHPYIYNNLSERDKECYREAERWSSNITHNMGVMARNVPISTEKLSTNLYQVCWRPEEIGVETVGVILPLLISGIHYMIDHRKELLQYNPENGWGDYDSFMKFLLDYKQACEDNDPECKIETYR